MNIAENLLVKREQILVQEKSGNLLRYYGSYEH